MLNSENNFEANIALMAISRKYSKKNGILNLFFQIILFSNTLELKMIYLVH